jgi:hypothetical protein
MSNEQSNNNTNNNNNNNNDSILTTLREIYDEVSSKIESFDLHAHVSRGREVINDKLLDNKIVQEVLELTIHPKQFASDVQSQWYECSSKFNEQFPYYASLARTQGPLIIGASTLIVAVPARG